MNRESILDLLREHKPTLAQRFGVIELALFGSAARDRAEKESDVDILVRFDGPATSKRYFGVQFGPPRRYIEDLLGRPVDLVTSKALRKELRPYVEREAIDVREQLSSEFPVRPSAKGATGGSTSRICANSAKHHQLSRQSHRRSDCLHLATKKAIPTSFRQ